MIIQNEISKKILTVSTSTKGKGGIASVVNTLAPYYETFYKIASTRSSNIAIMCCYFSVSIVSLLYYILIKRIKIVHIHGASYGSFTRKKIIINICHMLNTKILYQMHGGGFGEFYAKHKKKDSIDKTIEKVDTLITLSSNGKELFSTITDEKKIVVLYNMIENPHFDRVYKSNPTPIHFLFLGMITNFKGIFDLVEVIKENKEELTGKIILHIGGNGETKRLEELIDKYELRELIKFEGWVSGEQKKELLALCDVFILPSHKEAFALGNLEAMSYGMPVISTAVGGTPEVVFDGQNGFLMTPGDKQRILDCITHFITSPQEIERMGRCGTEVITRFYPEKIIPQLKDIYIKMLEHE